MSQANAKLREEDVREIRRMKSEGAPIGRLAVIFGVSRASIEAIVSRPSRRCLADETPQTGRSVPDPPRGRGVRRGRRRGHQVKWFGDPGLDRDQDRR